MHGFAIMAKSFLREPFRVAGYSRPFSPRVAVRVKSYSCDGGFGTELNLWPEPFGDEGPGQPIHGETEVMELPQMNVRANSAGLERLQKIFSLRFDNGFVAKAVQSFVFASAHPSFFGCS